MFREISAKLLAWKQRSQHRPLLVYGARQVGKTYAIKEFGRAHFTHCVYFDLEDSATVREAFSQNLDPVELVRKLQLLTPNPIIPGETLLILDEIQASNRAFLSLKYFAQNLPELDVVAAGSLLGVAVNREGFSAPVGQVETLTTHPMTFPEFLRALGKGSFVEEIQHCFANNEKSYLHNELLDLHDQYMLVGGMPQAVSRFVESGSIEEVREDQKFIRSLYLGDMAKYATPFETARIREVWESVPAQLLKEKTKFQYKMVSPGGRGSKYATAIDWLDTAGLVNRCHRVSSARAPLAGFAESSFFKTYLLDTGLLTAALGITEYMLANLPAKAQSSDASNAVRNVLQGGVTENFVAQTLIANGITPFYWESKNEAQIDFLYQTPKGACIPIEVKSSEHVTSKSLGVFVDRFQPEYSIRISRKNFGFENAIKSVPLYAAFCISATNS